MNLILFVLYLAAYLGLLWLLVRPIPAKPCAYRVRISIVRVERRRRRRTVPSRAVYVGHRGQVPIAVAVPQ